MSVLHKEKMCCIQRMEIYSPGTAPAIFIIPKQTKSTRVRYRLKYNYNN